MNENVLSQPWMSWSTLGHAFWRSTRIPSRTGSVHERTFGIPSTCIRQLGHPPVMQNRPRARWYLNERPVIETPAAASAEPIVSPSNASIVRPSNANETGRSRRMASPGRGGSRSVTRSRPRRRGSPPPDGSPVSLARPERPPDLVRPGVPFGQEPLPAPVAMQPPFGLPAVDVLAEEQVAGQVPVGCVGSGPARAFAAVGELERLPRPAVRTVDEEGHGRPLASLGTQTRQVTRSRTASSAFR